MKLLTEQSLSLVDPVEQTDDALMINAKVDHQLANRTRLWAKALGINQSRFIRIAVDRLVSALEEDAALRELARKEVGT